VDQSRFSNLSADYDDFLFATVCEDVNGTQLSVLSALARLDVDPWEEAARLAAMPRANAARTLMSMLDHACGKNNDAAGAEATVAGLVGLLPHAGESGTARFAPMVAAGAMKNPQRSAKASPQSYWWVWIGLALVVSFITPRPDAATNATIAENATMSQTEVHQQPTGIVANKPAGEGVPSEPESGARNAAPSPMAYSR